VNYIYSVATAQ